MIPVIGNSPKTIPIFQTCWKISRPKIPAVRYLSRLFLDLKPILINKASSTQTTAIVKPPPTNPNPKAITAKIKSVCASGRLMIAVHIPCPHRPAVPYDNIALNSWKP